MQKKTLSKLRYKSRALNRVSSSWGGAMKILQLVSRGTEVEASDDGLTVLSNKYGSF
jgi:hypothetical protein